VIGKIDAPNIDESSGVVESRRYPGVFWTHNDSGNASQLFAISRTGKLLASFDVAAMNIDWEDIAVDDAGHIYLADIGNNNGWRSVLTVYKLDEPDPTAAPNAVVDMKPDGKGATTVDRRLKILKSWKVDFPAGVKPFDCESLFIWKSDGYVISKLFNGTEAKLYKFPLDAKDMHTLERVSRLPIRLPCTGADLSADGTQLAVVTNLGPNLFELPAPGDFSKLESIRPAHVTWIDPTMEAICFASKTPDSPAGLMTTAEGRTVCLFPLEAFDRPTDALPADTTRVVVSHATTRPVVDGALDEWTPGEDEIVLRRVPAEAPAARLWARWTDEGIYLAGFVPSKSVRPVPKSWFAGDCVEVFIGNNGPGRGPDYGDGDDRCFVGFKAVKTEKGNPDAMGEIVLRWPRHDATPGRPEPVGQVAGRANVDGTWQFELFIPVAPDGRALRAGDTLRLNVSILSRDPRANWFVSQSNESGTWISPLSWAVAELK